MTDEELQELSQKVQGIQYKFSRMMLEESKVMTPLSIVVAHLISTS